MVTLSTFGVGMASLSEDCAVVSLLEPEVTSPGSEEAEEVGSLVEESGVFVDSEVFPPPPQDAKRATRESGRKILRIDIGLSPFFADRAKCYFICLRVLS